MATNFQEVVIGNVEQGRFAGQMDKEFSDLQKKLIAHVGAEGEKCKAEAVLTAKVKLQYADGAYRIVTDIDAKPPKKNIGGISTAFVETGEDGEACLFAQAGGTAKGNPHQTKLCSDTGDTISQQNSI